MVTISGILNLLIELIKNMSVLIVLAYILTRTRIYAAFLSKDKQIWKQKLCLTLICGLFAIYGTLSGIPFGGAIANIRDLGPAIAGLIGGPVIGFAAGLIGGIHRFTMGGITYIPCSISTVVAGIAGGLIHKYKKGRFVTIAEGTIFMALMEAFHMGLVLLIVRPFSQALVVAKSLSIPMILTNAVGMAIFSYIVQNYLNEKETQRTKELIESELSVAREIQMSIVPKIFPAFPGRSEFDVFATLEPAKEVGGDLYDFFLLDDDHLCFTVGDVSGKGVPASLFMAVTKTMIKAKADIHLSPDEILYQVNRDLCEDNDSGMFVTVFLGILTISSGEFTFSNGGHNIPYLLRKNGEVEALPKIPGIALGVMENAKYICEKAGLSTGDSLIVYTDGVTEAMNPAGELLSDHRLEKMLHEFSGGAARETVQHILKGTREFVNGAKQSDDITVLALKYLKPEQAEFRIKNEQEEISVLADHIENFFASNHLPEETAFQLNLSLDELLTNIISYGYEDRAEHEINIKITLVDKHLSVEIRDDGIPFNPLKLTDPDTTLDIEERPIGGLGIHLVRKMMDKMDYWREKDYNVLKLEKSIPFPTFQ